jgi:hypothetical protein
VRLRSCPLFRPPGITFTTVDQLNAVPAALLIIPSSRTLPEFNDALLLSLYAPKLQIRSQTNKSSPRLRTSAAANVWAFEENIEKK